VVALVLLDLSAAFDTIDHHRLIQRLKHHYGVTDCALTWFESYLKERAQTVLVQGEHSSKQLLEQGMPQGSGLGPRMYISYSKPLGRLIRSKGLKYHAFADDNQLYLVLSPSSDALSDTVSKIELCVREIYRWMTFNLLKLNEDKTEVIFFCNLHARRTLSFPSLTLGGNVINPKDSVRNLGGYLDQILSMEVQVSQVSKSCRFQLRIISRIRCYLTTEACKTLIQSLVISRLDYMNHLLIGCKKELIKKLQQVQNLAARIITKTGKYDHISSVLRDLHWLPVHFRIHFKVACLVYKALRGLAPKYVSDLLCICISGTKDTTFRRS